jgi:hypothetical protein
MQRKGVSYDIGRVMNGNWRPIFDPKVIHRELSIIKDGLHCNAVRICGLDIDRLMTASEDALGLGLEVWLSPEMWDKGQSETLDYLAKAARAAEKLHQRWPQKLVFCVGTEATLFMQGIVEGHNLMQRMGNPSFWETVKAGKHNPPLNAFLSKANHIVRQAFHGPLTYASLMWEAVDWSLFDFIGVDHYRAARIKDRYADMLKPFFAIGKPVVVTEFGCRTYRGADTSTEGMAGDLTDFRLNLRLILSYLASSARTALFGTQLPPPRMPLKKGDYVRDEQLQARELADQLGVLDRAGVNGAFVMTFISPIAPYDENPRNDLDMNSYSLVKSYTNRRGTVYPDLPWDPKESFQAVADFYAGRT